MRANNRGEVHAVQPALTKEDHSPTRNGEGSISSHSKRGARKASTSAKVHKHRNKGPESMTPGIKRATTELNASDRARRLKSRSRVSRLGSSRDEARRGSGDSDRAEMTEMKGAHGENGEQRKKDDNDSTNLTQKPHPPPLGVYGTTQGQEDSPALIIFPSSTVNLDKGASPQHQSIMDEIRIKRQQQLELMRQQAEDERQANITFPDFSDDESEDGDKDDEGRGNISPLRVTALRAWAIIRRHISEVAMEKKNKGAALNWSFLRQTIKRMTNVERGRQELYDRYLLHPDDWKDGIVNKHLLKGADARKYARNSDSEESVSPSPSKEPKMVTPRLTKAR